MSRLTPSRDGREGAYASPLLQPSLLLDLVPISRYNACSRIEGSFLYLRLRPNTAEVAELIEQGGAQLVLAVRGGRFEEGWPSGAEPQLDAFMLPWMYEVQFAMCVCVSVCFGVSVCFVYVPIYIHGCTYVRILCACVSFFVCF
jgi:hypothetical protein